MVLPGMSVVIVQYVGSKFTNDKLLVALLFCSFIVFFVIGTHAAHCQMANEITKV